MDRKDKLSSASHKAISAQYLGTIVVTGASRGIGAATALLAADAGYSVCVGFRGGIREAEAVVMDIQERGGMAIATQADVSAEEDVMRLFEAAKKLGPIVGLVNNAAILEPQAAVEDISYDRLCRVFATNALGPFLCAREAVRCMSKRHGGRGGAIVNVSSLASKFGSPGEYVDYAATKGALDTMTVGLAREVGKDGIRVNGVRPGHIYTGLHANGGEPDRVNRLVSTIPLGRGGQPNEVAEVIVWLLGEQSTYVSGAIIDVTGGK